MEIFFQKLQYPDTDYPFVGTKSNPVLSRVGVESNGTRKALTLEKQEATTNDEHNFTTILDSAVP